MGRVRMLMRRSALAGLVPVVLLLAVDGPKPPTLRGVTVRGYHSVADRTVDAVITSVVATPFGRIPVHAKVYLDYECTATFRAAVRYHALVRLMAALKGMRLVHSIDGAAEMGPDTTCVALPADSLLGVASVDSLTLTGALQIGADSVRFAGPAWWDETEDAYHAVLTTADPGCVTVRVNLFVGPRSRVTETRAESTWSSRRR